MLGRIWSERPDLISGCLLLALAPLALAEERPSAVSETVPTAEVVHPLKVRSAADRWDRLKRLYGPTAPAGQPAASPVPAAPLAAGTSAITATPSEAPAVVNAPPAAAESVATSKGSVLEWSPVPADRPLPTSPLEPDSVTISVAVPAPVPEFPVSELPATVAVAEADVTQPEWSRDPVAPAAPQVVAEPTRTPSSGPQRFLSDSLATYTLTPVEAIPAESAWILPAAPIPEELLKEPQPVAVQTLPVPAQAAATVTPPSVTELPRTLSQAVVMAPVVHLPVLSAPEPQQSAQAIQQLQGSDPIPADVRDSSDDGFEDGILQIEIRAMHDIVPGNTRQNDAEIRQFASQQASKIRNRSGEPIEFGMHPYEDRVFVPTVLQWEAPNLTHLPLYFSDPALERYGHTYPFVVQPFVSAAKFGGQLLGLPYQMACDPIWCEQYALGWYRPGEVAPKLTYQIPLNAKAAAVQAGVTTGLFFLIP